MRIPKQERETSLVELVETHNIALSLKRMNAAPYDPLRKRRALYHALTMCDCGFGREELSKIREAFNLP